MHGGRIPQWLNIGIQLYIYIFVYIYICVYTHVYIDMHAWSHGAPMDLQTKSHIWDPRAPIMSLCVDIRCKE